MLTDRTIACINACKGIPTESLKRNCINVLIRMAQQFLENQNLITECGVITAIHLIRGELDLSFDEDED